MADRNRKTLRGSILVIPYWTKLPKIVSAEIFCRLELKKKLSAEILSDKVFIIYI